MAPCVASRESLQGSLGALRKRLLAVLQHTALGGDVALDLRDEYVSAAEPVSALLSANTFFGRCPWLPALMAAKLIAPALLQEQFA